MDRVQARLKRARLRLYRGAPFYGHLVSHLRFVETESVPTAAVTPAGTMYYNPDFIAQLSTGETMGLIAHEVMHVAMLGHERQGQRDDSLWNVAQDIVINHLLVKGDFDLPDCGIIPEDGELTYGGVQFDNLDNESFETVYGALASNSKEVDGDDGFDDHIISEDGDGEGGSEGDEEDDEDEEEDGSGSIDSLDEKDWEQIMQRAKAVAQTTESAQGRGHAPGGGVDEIQAGEPGTVNYRRYVRQKISNALPHDYTYQRPNKRGRAAGVYLPSLKRREEQVTVAVVLDTSGSIGRTDLQRFAAEIQRLIGTFDAVDLVIVQHDAKVQRVDEYDRPKEADLDTITVEGRGGTDHHPPFEELATGDYEADLVIVYTDAQSSIPNEPPIDAAFLWVLNVNARTSPSDIPFGAVSRLDQ